MMVQSYEEYKKQMIELVKEFVNAVAEKEYGKLHSIAWTESWCRDGETQEEGFLSFGTWLDDQLSLWAEDEGRPFVVDGFNIEYLDFGEENPVPSSDGTLFCATYQPTNTGEQLDFWFELDGKLREDGTLFLVFDLNM